MTGVAVIVGGALEAPCRYHGWRGVGYPLYIKGGGNVAPVVIVNGGLEAPCSHREWRVRGTL